MLILALLQVVALEGGTVHTMLPGESPQVATVLVRDGRIEAVGPDLEVPAEATVVDASGQHLVPGLIDGMVHHDVEHDPLYVAAGVTFARDMGNDLGRIFQVRQEAFREIGPGPALFVCGALLDGVPPATTEAVIVTDAEEVDDKLPRLKELGADFVGFHLGVPESAWERAIEVAHELELQVWGPVPSGLDLARVASSGQDGLVYIEGFLPPGIPWQGVEPGDLDPALETFVASGMALTPLLDVWNQRFRDQGAEADVLALLAPHYEALWTRELQARRAQLTDEVRTAGAYVTSLQGGLLKRLWEAGVRLVPGSAAPNPWHVPGAGLHEELARWVAAGLPAEAVLRAATRGAAEVLGVEAERGAIAPGMVADLVCIDADPRVELDALRHPARVVLRGRVLENAELARLRAGVREAQAAARAAVAHLEELPAPERPAGRLRLEGRVEGRALGQRVALERYAVVELEEGGYAYCTRMRVPGSAGEPPAETTLTQRIDGGVLREFEMEVRKGESLLSVRGMRVGGQLRIERRLDGFHMDTNAVSARVALVDPGSGVAAMALTHFHGPGPVSALYFEDIDPAVGRWELELREDGAYAVKSGAGPWAALMRPDGSLERMERVRGAGILEFRAVDETPEGLPGMPLAAKGAGGSGK